MAFVVDGKVEGLEFLTYGLRYQTHDLATLKTWFGEPESVTYHKYVLGNDDAPEAVNAVWNKPDLKITFSGTLEGVKEYGTITIDTPKGQKERAKP